MFPVRTARKVALQYPVPRHLKPCQAGNCGSTDLLTLNPRFASSSRRLWLIAHWQRRSAHIPQLCMPRSDLLRLPAAGLPSQMLLHPTGTGGNLSTLSPLDNSVRGIQCKLACGAPRRRILPCKECTRWPLLRRPFVRQRSTTLVRIAHMQKTQPRVHRHRARMHCMARHRRHLQHQPDT